MTTALGTEDDGTTALTNPYSTETDTWFSKMLPVLAKSTGGYVTYSAG